MQFPKTFKKYVQVIIISVTALFLIKTLVVLITVESYNKKILEKKKASESKPEPLSNLDKVYKQRAKILQFERSVNMTKDRPVNGTL